MRFISVLTLVLSASSVGYAADIASLLTGKDATVIQFKVNSEDLANAKAFASPHLPENVLDKTFSVYGTEALKNLDAGCTVVLKGDVKEGTFSGKVDFFKVVPAQLFASEIRIGFRADSSIETLVCHYNESLPPSLEQITAELQGKINFTNLSAEKNPKTPVVKSLTVDQEVELSLANEDRTTFLGAVNGKVINGANKKSQYNRCTLVSYGESDVKKLEKGDVLIASNPAIALISTTGIVYAASSVDVRLKRTGDFYELNCIETNVENSTLESALQKHFAGFLTLQ